MLFENFQSSVSSHKFKLCNWDTNFFPPSPAQTRPGQTTFFPLHIFPPFLPHSSSLLFPLCQRCQVLITVQHLVDCFQYHAACQRDYSLFSVSCNLRFLTYTDLMAHVFLCYVLVPQGHARPDAGYRLLFLLSSLSLLPPLPSHHLPTGIISCWEICDHA